MVSQTWTHNTLMKMSRGSTTTLPCGPELQTKPLTLPAGMVISSLTPSNIGRATSLTSTNASTLLKMASPTSTHASMCLNQMFCPNSTLSLILLLIHATTYVETPKVNLELLPSSTITLRHPQRDLPPPLTQLPTASLHTGGKGPNNQWAHAEYIENPVNKWSQCVQWVQNVPSYVNIMCPVGKCWSHLKCIQPCDSNVPRDTWWSHLQCPH